MESTRFCAEGRNAEMVTPELKGLPKELPKLELPFEETLIVYQGTYALGSPEVDGTRYLMTFGLGTCVAIIGYSAGKKVGFLAHVDSAKRAVDALKYVSHFLGSGAKLAVIGGSQFNAEVVSAIKEYLGMAQLQLSGINTSPDRDPRSVALDTETGKVYATANLAELLKEQDSIDPQAEKRNAAKLIMEMLLPQGQQTLRYVSNKSLSCFIPLIANKR